MKEYSAFPNYGSLSIRLFSDISWTLVEGVLSLCRDAVDVFYSPGWLKMEMLFGTKANFNPDVIVTDIFRNRYFRIYRVSSIVEQFWFLCLMAYQSSQVIKCQGHSCRRTVAVLVNLLRGRIRRFIPFPLVLVIESERKSGSGVRARLLKLRSSTS